MLNKIQVRVVFDRKRVATRAHAAKPVTGLVQLSVTVNKDRHFLSTGVKVYSDQFTASRVVNRHDASLTQP